MPVDTPTIHTGNPSILQTPQGPISYWTLYNDQFSEQYEQDGNATKIQIKVKWIDRFVFRTYALGFAGWPASQNALTFPRYLPLQCPFARDQWLTSLRKVSVVCGQGPDSRQLVNWHTYDPAANNWFTVGTTGYIIYEATFANPPYDFATDDDINNYWGLRELGRFVSRKRIFSAKERKSPSYTFETYNETTGAAITVIPEVGFIPFYDYEFVYTWHKVPWGYVPETAITSCALKLNDAPFDPRPASVPSNPGPTPFAGYATGTILFLGLASELSPYRGPNEEWLCDVPYRLRYNVNGHNKYPSNDNPPSYTAMRVRNTTNTPPYGSANLHRLFRPGP